MDDFFPSAYMTTEMDDYVTDPLDYSGDYDTGPTQATGMCDRSWVRQFRGWYEPPLFWTIFTLGAVGNLLVVWIYSTVRNRLKTMTDVYLLNLAVADLLFLCTLPFWASDAIKGWEFGRGLCKTVSAVYKINFFSSTFLLMCISVDRYIAIVQVTKAQNWKEKRLFYSKLACVAIWVISTLLAMPEFLFAQVKTGLNGTSFCVMVYWNNANNRTKILVLTLQICMGFILPLLVMVFCYSVIIRTLLRARNFEKHKALRVIFIVVFIFLASQLPYNSLLMVEASQAANATITDCAMVKSFDVAGQVAKSLAYTHACLNPFLYVFVGVRFRQDLFGLIKSCSRRMSKDEIPKISMVPIRPSVVTDTETTPALSL
ncbi:C-C chemokine receptor type 9 isoform X1 [Corythoichthys intestinalis]|uniref:C-C chemokine receptor type 9 isoform X1 n=1 Tax=Corythoichthys intestinalis TaxID=161448 RepID=UPI0025A5D25B|nr:C-C chemokine receptor type 9 isoform X1 [Corythoichthys intestinalis]